MRAISTTIVAGMLGMIVLGAGCASPQARIKKNPEVFARYDVEQQAMIEAGQIGLGFDSQAVFLALGPPTRVAKRSTQEGTQEIWSYTDLQSRTYYGDSVYGGYCAAGSRYRGAYSTPTRVTTYRSRERMRVTFEADQVTAIESLESDRSY